MNGIVVRCALLLNAGAYHMHLSIHYKASMAFNGNNSFSSLEEHWYVYSFMPFGMFGRKQNGRIKEKSETKTAENSLKYKVNFK